MKTGQLFHFQIVHKLILGNWMWTKPSDWSLGVGYNFVLYDIQIGKYEICISNNRKIAASIPPLLPTKKSGVTKRVTSSIYDSVLRFTYREREIWIIGMFRRAIPFFVIIKTANFRFFCFCILSSECQWYGNIVGRHRKIYNGIHIVRGLCSLKTLTKKNCEISSYTILLALRSSCWYRPTFYVPMERN